MIGSQPNHPAIAPWITTLIGTIVGFTTAIFADVIKSRINERHKRRGIRKAMYEELAGIWGMFDAVLEPAEPTAEQAEMLMKVLAGASVDAYRTAKNDPALFYGLSEAATLDSLYARINIIKGYSGLGGLGLIALTQAKEFRDAFAKAIQTKKLDPKIFTSTQPLPYDHGQAAAASSLKQ